jgi:hypothetical protein
MSGKWRQHEVSRFLAKAIALTQKEFRHKDLYQPRTNGHLKVRQAGPEPGTNGFLTYSPESSYWSSVEGPESKVRGRRWWPHRRVGVVALVGVIACAMITSVVLYVDSAGSQRIPAHGAPASGGTTVTLDLVSIQNNYSELVGDLIVRPGPALLDSATDGLKQDLTVVITSTVTPVKRTWSKGMLPGVFPVPLNLARDVDRWPFDSYYTGPITVEVITGDSKVPERANVTFVDRGTGWKVHVGRVNNVDALAPYEIELQRSVSTMVFAIVILCILVAIAAIGLFVAIHTLRNPRRFQSPLTTWYAAMLFAVVPLRNALPGSPAFGSWIDLTIVLWVLVALVVSMLLYIAAWWRSTSKA